MVILAIRGSRILSQGQLAHSREVRFPIGGQLEEPGRRQDLSAVALPSNT